MTGNGANDTPVQSQPQAMRAAGREPAGGGTPVELVATSRLMNSHSDSGCRGQMESLSYKDQTALPVYPKEVIIYIFPALTQVCCLISYIGSFDCQFTKEDKLMNHTYMRGEMYHADLGQGIGSEQEGHRPVLIIQNNVGNKHSPTVIVAAVTSRNDAKAKLPTHYYLDAVSGLEVPSIVLLEQLRTVDKKRLSSYIGKLEEKHIWGINRALAVSVGLIEPMPKSLTICLCRTCANNFYGTGAYYLKRTNPIEVEKGICTYCNHRMGLDYQVIPRKI